MTNTYDISDITDRLEDLDSYLDDLENALESALLEKLPAF